VKVVAYGLFVLFAAGVSCLLVWMPASARPRTTVFAWVNLLAVPLVIGAVMATAMSRGGFDADVLAKLPGFTLYPIVWLAAAAAFVGYGTATLIGKAHETA
jgi:hypothetical protein